MIEHKNRKKHAGKNLIILILYLSKDRQQISEISRYVLGYKTPHLIDIFNMSYHKIIITFRFHSIKQSTCLIFGLVLPTYNVLIFYSNTDDEC